MTSASYEPDRQLRSQELGKGRKREGGREGEKEGERERAFLRARLSFLGLLSPFPLVHMFFCFKHISIHVALLP